MTENAAKLTSRGGRRSDLEVTERVAFVRELVKAHRDDRAKVHEGFVKFYGATPARTIDEYMRRVHRDWLTESKAERPSERAAFLAALDADLALYAKSKAWGAHQGARRLQARVLGLDVQQVDVRGGLTLTAARPPAEDEPLSTHELELATEILDRERARLAPVAYGTEPVAETEAGP